MPLANLRCDLFCAVVDNFGDIGICWRLARQLQSEFRWQVCLWVDDLQSFQKICPQLHTGKADQELEGVRIRLWSKVLPRLTDKDVPDVLLDALACAAPQEYLAWLNRSAVSPLWLNLEYLSAESWVEDCHEMRSIHPQFSLEKYFFFPGFSCKTGGLLRERERVQELRLFAADLPKQHSFWQRIGVPDAMNYRRKISLFAYSQPAISNWIELLSQQAESHLVVVPEGVLACELQQKYPELLTGKMEKGALSLRILPFVAQPDYDLLLASCDINFVRGEDSIIRAHWAGKPFIWQIYRQDERAHQKKLHAFLKLFLLEAAPHLRECITALFDAWEHEQDISQSWLEYVKQFNEIQIHTLHWQQFLMVQKDLASNLVRFVENRLIMSRNFS